MDTPPHTVAFLMDFATAVLTAEVMSLEAGVWNTKDQQPPDRGRKNGPKVNPGVVTPINLQVDATYIGDAGPGAIRVVNPGGTAGCVQHIVSNAPLLVKGETYAFFLQPSPDADGERHPELPLVLAAWPISSDGIVETAAEGPMSLVRFNALVANPIAPTPFPEPTPVGSDNPG